MEFWVTRDETDVVKKLWLVTMFSSGMSVIHRLVD